MTNFKGKEEAIKNAYGECWETVKDYVDGNGWIYDVKNETLNNIAYEFQKNDNFYRMFATREWRPKSLQGIENNNGWIKIESEDDLPKEYCDFFVCRRLDGDIFIGNFDTTKYFKSTFVKKYSHYQPIQKPEKPIY